MRPVRWLAWTVGVLFLIGTALQLVDTLNLYVTPPDTGAASIVQQRLASQDYRVAIWPIFALNNLSFGIAFVAISALGFALAAVLATGDTRRITLVTTLGIGGVLGAVGQLILLGATQVTIDIAYCDCGFKETEIVAQQWAGIVASDISDWLNRVAGVVLAIGLYALVQDAGARIPSRLRGWTLITAVALVLASVVATISPPGLDEIVNVLTSLIGAVLIPVWAVWLARTVDASSGENSPAGGT